jgi:hypothetical protein
MMFWKFYSKYGFIDGFFYFSLFITGFLDALEVVEVLLFVFIIDALLLLLLEVFIILFCVCVSLFNIVNISKLIITKNI